MMNHTVPKKVNHSTVVSQERTPSEAARRARAPGRADMLARTMGIIHVEDLPDCDHTVW